MHAFWVFYGIVGAVVMALNFRGMFVGFQHGAVQLNGFKGDTPEGRSEIRWMLYGLFAGVVGSGLLWPLFMPLTLRTALRSLEAGVPPTVTISALEYPLRGVDEDLMRALFIDLRNRWRQSRPERVGDPNMVSMLMNAAAIEGRVAFRDWSEKEGRVALVAAFKSVLDGPADSAEKSG